MVRDEFNQLIKKNNVENQKEMEKVKKGYVKRLLDIEPYMKITTVNQFQC